MITINLSISIYRPINRVFDFISAPENDTQWQYGTLASVRMDEGEAKVGGTFRSDGNLIGYRTQSTYEITEYEPNKKYGFKSLSGPLQSFSSYTFHMAKGFTQVNYSLQANKVNVVELNENILGKKIKKQFKEYLAMLKSILESE